MRVLLSHPPLNAGREVTPPLGLCTLAAWLKGQGHEVRILDLDLEIKARPDGSHVYLGLLERAVADFSPAAVGITSMYNNSLQAERMARTVKACDPSILTIGGGSHFGALGPQALRRIPELDFAIEGEGEQAFSTLLAALEAGTPLSQVPRLHYRVNDQLRANPPGPLLDLAELPPMWSTLGSSIDLRRYAETVLEGSPRRTIYIEAGRGCPFACSFCATAPFWERRYRVKPVERIVEEMRFLYEQFGYDGFMLVHDLLTVDKQFINDFSDAMTESRLPVEWMANHRTDINLHGLLPKMKTAGCWAMFFGVESASARLQKVMRKGLKREGVVSTIRGLSDLGIASTCSFVMGFPDETSAELSSTIRMGAELKLIGAGMIQFHRLRTWPPAPLSRGKLPSQFDLASLRIEYPFVEVPPDDVAAIEKDPEFFAGYFAPHTTAGTFAQLADVELFFTQAVAAAPLTIAVLGRVMAASLIDSFYTVVSHRGAITREDVEADTTSLLPIWRLLRPFLEEWVTAHPALETWERELVRGVMAYEEHRLRFVNGADVTADEGVAALGENWSAFFSNVDIAAVFEAMQTDQPLTPALVRASAVVLVSHESNSYRAYTTDVAHLPDLASHPFLLEAAAS
ncbi:MAG TPA: radical SAM protein [Thermoanaerobaculia bacterium]|jgi:radical SAM superfamily enzyme YgiQ (UPF0313 family)|nr:radical SAM protein [Thermoanaerobaculia bacterium]